MPLSIGVSCCISRCVRSPWQTRSFPAYAPAASPCTVSLSLSASISQYHPYLYLYIATLFVPDVSYITCLCLCFLSESYPLSVLLSCAPLICLIVPLCRLRYAFLCHIFLGRISLGETPAVFCPDNFTVSIVCDR